MGGYAFRCGFAPQRTLRSGLVKSASSRGLAKRCSAEPDQCCATVGRRHAEVHRPAATVRVRRFNVDRLNIEVHRSTLNKHRRNVELGCCHATVDRCLEKVHQRPFVLRLWTIGLDCRNVEVRKSTFMEHQSTVELHQRTVEVDECNSSVRRSSANKHACTFALDLPTSKVRWRNVEVHLSTLIKHRCNLTKIGPFPGAGGAGEGLGGSISAGFARNWELFGCFAENPGELGRLWLKSG